MASYSEILTAMLNQYESLCETLLLYPADKREQPNASGIWSAKQVIAYLTGEIQTTNSRFNLVLSGNPVPEDVGKDDPVSLRRSMNWSQTLDEFFQSANTFIDVANRYPTNLRNSNQQISKWLQALSEGFEEHHQALKDFLDRG